MKTTKYFDYIRERTDRKVIKDKWIIETMDNPDYEEVQLDGRIRKWKKIVEANNKYLRVILSEDGKTVHNAFFDRSFRR